MNFLSYKLEDIQGSLVSESLLGFDKTGKLLKIIKEVYQTNNPKQLYYEYSNGDIICRRLNVKIVKINNFIYVMGKDETDYNIFSLKQNKFFDNYHEAIVIIQKIKLLNVIKNIKNYKIIQIMMN